MPVGNCWNKIGMHENNYVFKKQTLSLPPPSFSHEYTINNFFHFSIVLINNYMQFEISEISEHL